MQKGAIFMEVCQHFCPSFSECKIVLLRTSWAVHDSDFNWNERYQWHNYVIGGGGDIDLYTTEL